jgi:predicted dehydrogenase
MCRRQMLNIGLIGAGWHSLTHHAPALRQLVQADEFRGHVRLACLCDLEIDKAEAAATSFGFDASCRTIDELLAQVDAAVSVLPAKGLPSSIDSFMRCSCPVLVEKPLGDTLDQAREVARKLACHPHMVSLNRRFDPGVRVARQWMAEQASPAHVVHGLMSRHNRSEGDFAWSTGVHLSDLMCFLVGPLKLVAGRRVGHGGAGCVGLIAGENVSGTIQFLPTAGRVEEMVQVSGEGWSLQVNTGTHQPWRVQGWHNRNLTLDASAELDAPEFVRNGTADETVAFVRALLHHQPLPGPSASDVLPGSELADALQQLVTI